MSSVTIFVHKLLSQDGSNVFRNIRSTDPKVRESFLIKIVGDESHYNALDTINYNKWEKDRNTLIPKKLQTMNGALEVIKAYNATEDPGNLTTSILDRFRMQSGETIRKIKESPKPMTGTELLENIKYVMGDIEKDD